MRSAPEPPEGKAPERAVPRGVHVLTGIHGIGSLACVTLSIGSALSAGFRRSLVQSEGSRMMVETPGPWTWAFLAFIAVVLGALSYGSWNLRAYAWPMTLAVYAIGVLGSLWQVSLGVTSAWVSSGVNAGVVAYALRPHVRRAYGWGERPFVLIRASVVLISPGSPPSVARADARGLWWKPEARRFACPRAA